MEQRTHTWQEFIQRKELQFQKELEKEKTVFMKDIGREGRHAFVREAWTFMPQHNLPEKVFVIERLRKFGIEGKITHTKTHKTGDIEYRIGYYIVGKIRKAKGHWMWGQFCPIVPSKDFKKLISKAETEGMIL